MDLAVRRQVDALYVHHHPWLSAWLLRKLGNRADAADLAQDTFVRVITSTRLSPSLGKEPRALLTHIAKGLVVDHWRRKAVEQAYLEALAQLPLEMAPTPEARMEILETLVTLEAMLRSLAPRTRQIFIMAQLDGMTYPQIAMRLSTSLITVKRHMRTAFSACLALA